MPEVFPGTWCLRDTQIGIFIIEAIACTSIGRQSNVEVPHK